MLLVCGPGACRRLGMHYRGVEKAKGRRGPMDALGGREAPAQGISRCGVLTEKRMRGRCPCQGGREDPMRAGRTFVVRNPPAIGRQLSPGSLLVVLGNLVPDRHEYPEEDV